MSKIDQIHLRAVMLCMIGDVEDVKDRSNTPKGCNAMYVEDVKDMYQIHLRAVMLCMSKMGKEHTHTFWSITSLILNGFSILMKSFGKHET